ncbi:MAG: SIS domain-containing protein [Nitriliruptoraceae bacterium]|nr:SIS domain-containing protein [Nitriliruptoraceae bacterium]
MTATTTAMAREIAEQPDTIAATIAASLGSRDELRRLASGRRHVLLVARGSSDNAAVYGRYLLESHTGRSASLAAPSLATHYQVRREMSDTLVVSLSQSGETEEIVGTQAWGAASGARTVAITNVADSALAREADLALVTPAGPERAVPATKSYTSQLAAIAAIADALGPPASSLEPALAQVPDAVRRVLADRDGIEAAVAALGHGTGTLVSGRGLCYGTALETALKLEETCLRPVRGLSYADLRHGPIAVVDRDLTAVLVAAADGPMTAGMTHLAAELRDRGARTVGIGGDPGFAAAVDVPVAAPAVPETVAPLVTIVPAQLIVESLARTLGLDPDAPRGLSKVTRTDVSGSSD